MRMKLLLVDDHAVVRAGLQRLLAASAGTTVLEAANGRDALALIRSERPDLVVLDMNLPGLGGLELLRRLLQEQPGLRVLVLTMHDDLVYAEGVLQAGASGFVTKNTSAEELLAAIQRVSEGGRYIEHEIAQALALRSVAAGNAPPTLSEREHEILRLLANGYSLGEIAEAIGVSYKTIANACSQIKTRLGVERTTELVRMAVELGLS
jgi:DNA-binding NarL/FixJ family response regulator